MTEEVGATDYDMATAEAYRLTKETLSALMSGSDDDLLMYDDEDRTKMDEVKDLLPQYQGDSISAAVDAKLEGDDTYWETGGYATEDELVDDIDDVADELLEIVRDSTSYHL